MREPIYNHVNLTSKKLGNLKLYMCKCNISLTPSSSSSLPDLMLYELRSEAEENDELFPFPSLELC
jgi:hypothetical protein